MERHPPPLHLQVPTPNCLTRGGVLKLARTPPLPFASPIPLTHLGSEIIIVLS